MSNNIDEGLFFADRVKSRIAADTEEKAIQKYNDWLQQNKNYNPKATTSKPIRDRLGRFYFDVTYDKKSGADDKSIMGLAKKGIGKAKEVIKNIPRQGTLTAKSQKDITKQMKQFQVDHPDVRFGRVMADEQGNYSVTYVAKKSDSSTPATSQTRINNIQKQLAKLSDDKLAKIEDLIKT